MQAGHYSSLLPEIFRHKTTKVRIIQPQVILLDFHGTISERKWEHKVIFPYVKKALPSYMRENISNDLIQNSILSLKNESFEQRFRFKNEDAPIIDDFTSMDEMNATEVAQQLSDFLLWQMHSKKETKDTEVIERLVWQDGFRRKQIQTPIYDDVSACLRQWRDLNIKLYIISSLETETLKLLFENTDKGGNLNQLVSGYVSTKSSSDKLLPETYRSFYESCHLAQTKANNRKPAKPKSPNGLTNSRSSSKLSLTSSQSSEFSLAKPVLFLTDSGQEAKAASQVSEGQVFDCILVNRPGNKRVRSYYLTQFAYIEKFDDIEFVQ